jgi:hypothetical protein
VSDDVVWVTWHVSEEEKINGLRHTNEVIDGYVTTGARLKLYSYLDALGVRAMYCDTDTVIYVQNVTEAPLVECGDNLGDMTNERHELVVHTDKKIKRKKDRAEWP